MYVEFPLPLSGLSEGLPVSNERSNTTGYASNVRPRDVLETRFRIGQRLGLKKAYSQQVSGIEAAIVFIGSVTVLD